MAFGQASGPPASYKQIELLEDLLQRADFGSFREARHRLGLTQRQANGKFTSQEASDLIDRLTTEFGADEFGDTDATSTGAAATKAAGGTKGSTRPDASVLDAVRSSAASDRAEQRQARQRDELLAGMPADAIADELTRRGWLCMPPAD